MLAGWVVWLWTIWISLPIVAGSAHWSRQHALDGDDGEGFYNHSASDANPQPSLGRFIPACVFINLKRRTDRLQHIQGELHSANLPCERLEAHDSEVENILPREGCRRSHIDAVTRIKQSGAPYGLVLEDDAAWTKSHDVIWNVLQHVADDIKRHPVILLHCFEKEPLSQSEKPWLWNLGFCHSTAAYIVRADYIDTLLYTWRKPIPGGRSVDWEWKPLQVSDHWAATRPFLIRQARENLPSDLKPQFPLLRWGRPEPGNASHSGSGARTKSPSSDGSQEPKTVVMESEG